MANIRMFVFQFLVRQRKVLDLGTKLRRRINTITRQSQVYVPTRGHSRTRASTRPKSDKSRPWKMVICAGVGTAVLWGAVSGIRLKSALTEQNEVTRVDLLDETGVPEIPPGERRRDLPDFHKDEINKHKDKETGIWVTFRDGVYDVTTFVEQHPGGTNILSAAGGPVEPFWEIYKGHDDATVLSLLEEMRIGNLHPADTFKEKSIANLDNLYAKDPLRHPGLEAAYYTPFNAGPRQELLVHQFLTPNELFFVRNHFPVPEVDVDKYRLEVSVEGTDKKIILSLDDLKSKFQVHKVVAAIQCAGGRRSDMANYKKLRIGDCGINAISNAEWTGVKLSDVLEHAGVIEGTVNHIQFEGLDKDVSGLTYGVSIPAETAMDPNRDVLLAFEMNGKEIPRDHGFPVRVVVPGTIGARQVKWLSKIKASQTESTKPFQTHVYKLYNPSASWQNADYINTPALHDYPVQSAICVPRPGTTLQEGAQEVTVRGYAWAGGGRGVSRVDVSTDGGKTWHTADLEQAEQKVHRQWAWTLWEKTVPITKNENGEVEIVCKAIDTACNTQPSTFEHIWNISGYICNAWHRVRVDITPIKNRR